MGDGMTRTPLRDYFPRSCAKRCAMIADHLSNAFFA
jgi:hypothetical protein